MSSDDDDSVQSLSQGSTEVGKKSKKDDDLNESLEVIEREDITDEEWIASLPEKEVSWYDRHTISTEELEGRKVVCTACFKQENHKQRGLLVRHPTLGVPVCKTCKNFYYEGAWSKDSEGAFEFCGWCANGGDLICCSSDDCPNSFCTKCIKRNLGRTAVSTIQDCEEWKCFECKPVQLKKLRVVYYSMYKYWEHERMKAEKRQKNRQEREKNKGKNPFSRSVSIQSLEGVDMSDPLWKTYSDADDFVELLQNYVKKEKVKWKNVDVVDRETSIKAARRMANLVAVSRHNMDKLLNRLTDHLAEQFGKDASLEKQLREIADDVTALSPEGGSQALDSQSSSQKEDVIVMNGVQDDSPPIEVSVESKKNDDEEELKYEKIKLEVLKSTTEDSSDNEASEATKPSPKSKKHLKSKKQLDAQRHVVDHVSESDTDTEQVDEKSVAEEPKLVDHEETTTETKENGKAIDEEKVVENKLVDYEDTTTDVIMAVDEKEKHLVDYDETTTESQVEEDKKKKAAGLVDYEETTNEATMDETPKKLVDYDETTNEALNPNKKEEKHKGKKVEEKKEEKKSTVIFSVTRKSDDDDDDDSDDREGFSLHVSSSDEDRPKTKKVSEKKEKEKKDKEKKEKEKKEKEKKEKEKKEKEKKEKEKMEKEKEKKEKEKETEKKDKVEKKEKEKEKETEKKEKKEKVEMKEKKEKEDSFKEPLSPEEKLRNRFKALMDKIDVAKDKKIQSKPVVCASEMDKNVVKQLKEKHMVDVTEHESLMSQLTSKKKKNSAAVVNGQPRSEYAMFDAEIDRLCNLGALDKMTSSSKGRKAGPKSSKQKDINNKKKNGVVMDDEIDLISDDDEYDVSSSPEKEKLKKDVPTSNDMAKAAVLASSSSSDVSDEEISLKDKKKKQHEKKKSDKKDDDESEKKKQKKKRGADPDFLKVKLDESDSEEDEEKARKRREKRLKKHLNTSSDDDDIMEISPKKVSPPKAKGRRKHDDSEEEHWETSDEGDKKKSDACSDSDIEIGTKKRKIAKRKKKASSSSPEDSDEEPRAKKKRKRIKKNSSSEGEDGEDKSPSKGRKDIRKIIKDKNLSETTKTAAEDERERRKRVTDRQKLYNELYEIKDNATVTEVPLDIDQETKEVLVEVDKRLVKKFKPHQARGVKFMWDAVFESQKDVEAGKVPGGAILAHCMGLGKTLQTIGLIHTAMATFPTTIECVLVLAPVNTVKNWEDEFHKWLTGPLSDDIEVYEMSVEKDNWGRADRLAMWRREGGVMIMGYDMFRNLTNQDAKKFKKKQRQIFQESLVDPGPQMVICDEGHVLKNTKSALNAAMNRITTLRRIILTGTPLQNNLSEYFAMVDFVKPKLLGTYAEFKNRFVNPIANGQNSDSTDRDVRVMKKRSFILNDLLKGCMQRLDYNVLVPFLQPKYEYVLCVCLTDFQKKLYTHYLDNYARAGQITSDGKLEGGKKGGLFYDVQNLSRVWNHPFILEKAKERQDYKRMMDDDPLDDEEGSLKDFIDDGSESEAKSTSEDDNEDLISGSDEEEEKKKKRRMTTRGRATDSDGVPLVGGLDEARSEQMACERGWWTRFIAEGEDNDLMRLELGSKMVLLMDILRECRLIGDKVLLFSQSLLSLDLIESFLLKADTENSMMSNGGEEDEEGEGEEGGSKKKKQFVGMGQWAHGRDYFRMDGSTPPDQRRKWCSYFNKKSNSDMRLFLISTRAGGLGINLVAANRVVIFDASWNPAHDVQSIFRVYRFGQDKPVYIYRFLAKGTMEEKIYDRQVTKQSLSARVVDEQQIERHFSMNELAELYVYNDEPKESQPPYKMPQDKLLAEMLLRHKELIWKFHDHDSLLENQVDEHLTEAERKAAWEEYENEKKGISSFANASGLNMNVMMSNINPEEIRAQYRQQYPHLTEDQINHATRAYIMQIQSGVTRRPAYDKSHYQQEMARAKAQQQQLYPGMYQARLNRPTSSISERDIHTEAQRVRQLQDFMQKQQQEQAQMVWMQQQLLENQRVLAQQRNRRAVQNQQPETITLDEGGADEEEILLDGDPEFEEYQPRPSSSRRGRPRLDPDTDPMTIS